MFMIKTTIKHKVTLKLYAALSLFSAIITLLYSSTYEMLSDNIYIPIGIIGLFIVVFIFVLRSFILDVISIDPANKNEDDTDIVEIKRIDKMAIEFIAIISNFMIIVLIFFYGYEKSEGVLLKFFSIIFIILLLIPILFLIQSIILDSFFDRHQIYSKIINYKTLIIIFIVLIIIFLNSAFVGKITTSIEKVYTKSISVGDDSTLDISSNILITSISGEIMDKSGVPINQIYINIKGTGMDVDIDSILLKYINENTTSTLKYGVVADESHFSFEGKKSSENDTKLEIGDKGTITINLSSTNQELYPHKKGTVQILPGNDKILSKDFNAGEFNGDYVIMLYSAR